MVAGLGLITLVTVGLVGPGLGGPVTGAGYPAKPNVVDLALCDSCNCGCGCNCGCVNGRGSVVLMIVGCLMPCCLVPSASPPAAADAGLVGGVHNSPPIGAEFGVDTGRSSA